MRRMRVVALTGCLLVAGGAGTGTASAGQPEERATRASTVVDVRPGDPDLPDPDPRSVEPDGRRPGAMPHLVPQGPGPVPIPKVRPARPRPAPMPRLLTETDQLVPLDELLSGPQ